MTTEETFAVVEFDDGLQIVPVMWLDEDAGQSWWPGFLTSKFVIDQAVTTQMPPSGKIDGWTRLDVKRIFGKTDTWDKALNKVVEAERTSYLEETNEFSETANIQNAKRKRRRKADKVLDSSDSESYGEESDMSLRRKKATKRMKTAEQSNSESFIHNYKVSIRIPTNGTTPRTSSTTSTSTGNIAADSHSPIDPSRHDVTVEHSMSTRPRRRCNSNDGMEERSRPNNTKSNDEFQKFVVDKLTEISLRLGSLEQEVRKIESSPNLRDIAIADVDVEEELDLPLKSIADLKKFEGRLKEKEFVHKIVRILRNIGGNEVNRVVPSMLKKLLTDPLAEFFSWDGRQDKKAFKLLETAKLIRKVAHVMCAPRCTDGSIKNFASKWLAQAKTRRIRLEYRKLQNNFDDNADNFSVTSHSADE